MKFLVATKHLISMNDMDRQTIESIFQHSEIMLQKKGRQSSHILQDKKLGVMFYQTSTRTRLNFETAMLNLGGNILGFSDVKTTRAGDFFRESLEDTVKVIGQMVDCIVIRHFNAGAAKKASQISSVPVINAGDGSNEHPTQALIDLWMTHKYLGGLDGICFGFVGDPSTRVIRSILLGLCKFKPKKILFLMPTKSFLSDDIISLLTMNNISYQLYNDICDLLKDADVIEMLPIYLPDLNSECNEETAENLITPDHYRLSKKKMLKTKRFIPILHPGPRLDELSPDMDDLPQTLYFEQVKNAVFLRMALLEEIIN